MWSDWGWICLNLVFLYPLCSLLCLSVCQSTMLGFLFLFFSSRANIYGILELPFYIFIFTAKIYPLDTFGTQYRTRLIYYIFFKFSVIPMRPNYSSPSYMILLSHVYEILLFSIILSNTGLSRNSWYTSQLSYYSSIHEPIRCFGTMLCSKLLTQNSVPHFHFTIQLSRTLSLLLSLYVCKNSILLKGLRGYLFSLHFI